MQTPSLNLCFFWHMHQPDYRGSDGVMTMPWVFMHAIKDYYDMPWLVSRYPGLKATFNITAPLIEQLSLYSDPLANDYFLSLWEAHPSSLEISAREWVVKICKATQYETMVRSMERFDALYHQETYSDNELIDLETVFLLTWCGRYLREHNPIVRGLIDKGEGYTQSDKSRLLETLCAFIQTILPLYAALQERGVISVSTTPYNHPILPLLIDMHNGTLANPDTPLPQRPLSLREDALVQVERSMALYEKTFGRAPSGFWPAEGAVDEASVLLYKEMGIRWIATDEAILFRSLRCEERSLLYTPYRYEDVTIGFRDHGLSDLIGFAYRFQPARNAADHFVGALERIAAQRSNATVFVIVDGENAWEFYENNGTDFLTALYGRLETCGWCGTMTFDEASRLDPPLLHTLAPGSWIHGTFDTWIGHPEKNRAWELIYQTRRDADRFHAAISSETAEAVLDHFLAAECSDWFWWYGDDHVSEFADAFDALFRGHLIAIYELLRIPPPADLYEPIRSRKNGAVAVFKPQSMISPVIDGTYRSFFEWVGSGSIDERASYSTMDRVRGPVHTLYYGQDDTALYVAFEGELASLERSNLTLAVIVEETGEERVFALDRPCSGKNDRCVLGERLELALSKSRFASHLLIHLRFELLRGSEIVQTLPGNGALAIDVHENYARNWFI